MRYRQPAICLRTYDYSETSQVVHFLARDQGAVRLLAKGTKRPKSKSGGAIDLLAEGDLVYSQKNVTTLGTLMEFHESVSHTDLRNGLRRLYLAQFALELVHEMLAEGDPHPEVFDLLHNTLIRLGQPDAPLEAVTAYFQWRLLRHVGLLGGLSACVACGMGVQEFHRQSRVYFSSRIGGLLCDGCEGGETEKFSIEPAAMSGIAALAAAETGQKVALPETQAHAVMRLLTYHACQQMGKSLRLAKYAVGPLSSRPRQ